MKRKEQEFQQDIPEIAYVPTPAEAIAGNLSVLMQKLDGDDKCVVCNAIQELTKKPTDQSNSTFGNDYTYMLLIMLLCSGFGNSNSNFGFDKMLKAYLDYLEKQSDSEKIE